MRRANSIKNGNNISPNHTPDRALLQHRHVLSRARLSRVPACLERFVVPIPWLFHQKPLTLLMIPTAARSLSSQ